MATAALLDEKFDSVVASPVPEARPARPASSNYLPTLDGWRAVAILAVLICHGSDQIFSEAGPWPNEQLHAYTRHGSLGVDIFFGISGFLICTRLLQEQQRSGRISLRGFYIRRAFRILPASFTYLAVVGFLGLTGLLYVGAWQWLSCLLFFRNYVDSSAAGGWYTGHFWSLCIEEHFYLFWPGLLVLLGTRRARWGVAGMALAVAVWRALEFRHQWLGRFLPESGFYARTDIRLDGLLWGCWMALLFSVPRVRAWLTRWLSLGVWLAMAGAFLALVKYHPPMSMLGQAFLIPLLLVATIVRPRGLVGRVLETMPMRWIGRISYSLYLWQQLFLVGSREPRPLPFGPLQEWPLNVAACFACAALSFYVIERPLIHLGQRLAGSEALRPH
jgi:peptidoglycan/LPS O-acetylase OafA/YrhL